MKDPIIEEIYEAGRQILEECDKDLDLFFRKEDDVLDDQTVLNSEAPMVSIRIESSLS